MSANPAAAAALSPGNLLQLGLGFWGSKTLLTGVELGLFTLLAEGPLDAETIRTRLSLHPRSILDFLDALVALGVLNRQNGVYGNTPESDAFLDRNKPAYVGGMLEMANVRLYKFWGSLTDALRSGDPQNEVKDGVDLFGTLYEDPERLRNFLKAMTGLSAGSGRAIAAKFPWDRYKTFIDIGCAQGGTPGQIALAHPHLSGGGFDLPEVRPTFEEYMIHLGISDRMRFYEGSFFDVPLPSADVLIMGHILHDWDLGTKLMLLRKAYDALPAGGSLIVYEALIDNERKDNAFGLLMSLNMLIETRGGFDFTGADCEGWMRETGFTETRVEHLAGPESMVIGVK